MRKNILIALVFLTCLTQVSFAQRNQPMEFVMDMVHNNPGGEPYITKYNDPVWLKSQGFNSMVTHWYVNCAITYDDFEKNIIPENSEERKWIERQAVMIDKKLDECEKAGINVYPFTDFIVFPQSIWQKYGDKITGKGNVGGTGGFSERSRKPDMQSPLVQQLVRKQVAGIFERFPKLDGLVLRFGETYLQDTPFHRGGSPIRDGDEGITDHVTLINILRDEVCVKRNKKLFYRTWDFGFNFHNNPGYYLKVTNQIKPHPNLIFSIKYQQDDFHRMTPFNPCLGIGKHRQIVESQSRMEAYGKGAHPYYVAPGVIEGWPETKYEIEFGKYDFAGKLNNPVNPRGIKDILDKKLLCGIMTWSNGGGWDGPYIKHEIWTDLNTYVVSQWAQHPEKTEKELFYEFAENLGLKGYQADLFRQLNMLTIEGVRKGHMNSYVENHVWWTRDQYFSAEENKNITEQIIEKNKVKEVLAEKSEATAIWYEIEALSRQIKVSNEGTQEALEVSCTYGRIKYSLIEQMWRIMIYNAMGEKTGTYNTQILTDAVQKYDALWKEWKDLKESSQYCATLYTDLAFRGKRKGSIGELVENVKKILNGNITSQE